MLQRASLLLLMSLVCVFSGINTVFGQATADKVGEAAAPSKKFSSEERLFPVAEKTNDVRRKFEAGIFFTSLMRDGDGDRNGFGVRLTYDFTTFGKGKYIAAWDSEVSFLPGDRFVFTPRSDGRVLQGFSGLKIGRKWEKFGIFAKARPGFVQYSRGKQDVSGTFANPVFISEAETNLPSTRAESLNFIRRNVSPPGSISEIRWSDSDAGSLTFSILPTAR